MSETKINRVFRNLRQFLKFGIVGASGTVVNLASLVIMRKALLAFWNISEHDAFANLFGSVFHIRWYHMLMTLAFLIANTWNYQLNRMWTFKSNYQRSWWRGYIPFLLTGATAFVVNLVVLTLTMNPTSPVALPSEIFDDSTGFRTKFYWASVIAILASMPVNFVINKLWTFRKPKLKVVEQQAPQ